MVLICLYSFLVFSNRADQNECEQSVYDAIMAGYRLIDTAACYLNEEAGGRAIKRIGVAREEYLSLWVQDADYDTQKSI